MSKKIWYFNDFNLLKSLSDEERIQVSKMAGMKESSKKEVIYFLKHGKVKISKYGIILYDRKRILIKDYKGL